ncbi:MAG: acyl carrier protein [Clostridiales bacterium]|nr:acyl carrier protein [Clostridiales bacterium]
MVMEKIIAIIGEKLDVPVESITAASSFDDMRVDSLAMVEIMLAIEEEYNITIDESEGLETVADITAYVEKKLV